MSKNKETVSKKKVKIFENYNPLEKLLESSDHGDRVSSLTLVPVPSPQ